ncbi:MAG: hypothetical protein CO182_10535, partial [Lysobacterales bacterium CG_4_9_14_3_um_filter_62_6]
MRARSPIGGKYDTAVNRDSAYERLQQRAASVAPTSSGPAAALPKA